MTIIKYRNFSITGWTTLKKYFKLWPIHIVLILQLKTMFFTTFHSSLGLPVIGIGV